jgi:hypothetical protein
MIKIAFVPLWLSTHLANRGLSKTLVTGGEEALVSILGKADVKAYSLTQRLLNKFNSYANLLGSFNTLTGVQSSEGSVTTVTAAVLDIRQDYPEQAAMISRFNEDQLFFALAGLGIESYRPEASYGDKCLDFQFEVINDTLVISTIVSDDPCFDNRRPGERAKIYLNALKAISMMMSWRELAGSQFFTDYLAALNRESTASLRQIA